MQMPIGNQYREFKFEAQINNQTEIGDSSEYLKKI